MRDAVVTVDLAALAENVSVLKRALAPAYLIAVAKADAYGHGLSVVGPWFLSAGADLLAVAFLDEVSVLSDALPEGCGRVLCMDAIPPADADEAVALRCILTVCSLAEARALSEAAVRQRRDVSVHLKVDTGMSRLGVSADQADALARAITALPGLRLTGAYTHLAAADDPDETHARNQLALWDRATANLPLDVRRHVLASAGYLRFPEFRQGGVRTGLLVYGVDPGIGIAPPPVRPALTLTSRVASVREIPEGATVSYGATFRAPKPMRIGTIPVGYADGWPRALSGRGSVVIRGLRTPILGRVCMDRFMIDLTPWPDAGQGEPVTLIGPGQDVNDVAADAGTINHEILARLGPRLRREYVGGGQG